jgi:hypothetical protein
VITFHADRDALIELLGIIPRENIFAHLSVLAMLSSPGEQDMRLTAIARIANHLNTGKSSWRGLLA